MELFHYQEYGMELTGVDRVWRKRDTYMIFRRKIYKKLKEWKEEAKGSKALLIEGAKRIGKSTIVEIFAEKECGAPGPAPPASEEKRPAGASMV